MIRLGFQSAPLSPVVLLAAAVMMSVGGAQGSATQFVDHASRQLAATDRQHVAQVLASLADAARRFQGDPTHAVAPSAPKLIFGANLCDEHAPRLDDACVPAVHPLRDALLNLPPPTA